MNTTFYYNSGVIVIHRIIPSEYIDSVAHDYKAARIEQPRQDVVESSSDERAKERMKVLTAKSLYKQFKGAPEHNEQRQEFLAVLLKARIPNWGSITFSEL